MINVAYNTWTASCAIGLCSLTAKQSCWYWSVWVCWISGRRQSRRTVSIVVCMHRLYHCGACVMVTTNDERTTRKARTTDSSLLCFRVLPYVCWMFGRRQSRHTVSSVVCIRGLCYCGAGVCISGYCVPVRVLGIARYLNCVLRDRTGLYTPVTSTVRLLTPRRNSRSISI